METKICCTYSNLLHNHTARFYFYWGFFLIVSLLEACKDFIVQIKKKEMNNFTGDTNLNHIYSLFSLLLFMDVDTMILPEIVNFLSNSLNLNVIITVHYFVIPCKIRQPKGLGNVWQGLWNILLAHRNKSRAVKLQPWAGWAMDFFFPYLP